MTGGEIDSGSFCLRALAGDPEVTQAHKLYVILSEKGKNSFTERCSEGGASAELGFYPPHQAACRRGYKYEDEQDSMGYSSGCQMGLSCRPAVSACGSARLR
jgi:hypothetical protein